MLILNEGDNPHLRLTLGALKWIYLINALNAGGPSTLTELTAVVALCFALFFLCGMSLEFSPFASGADGFILRYGTNPLQLNSELSLAISDLREERDSEYGPVYRYLIRAVTDSSPVFVSIASRKGDRVSNFSEAIEEAKRPAANHTPTNY